MDAVNHPVWEANISHTNKATSQVKLPFRHEIKKNTTRHIVKLRDGLTWSFLWWTLRIADINETDRPPRGCIYIDCTYVKYSSSVSSGDGSETFNEFLLVLQQLSPDPPQYTLSSFRYHRQSIGRNKSRKHYKNSKTKKKFISFKTLFNS